MRHVIHSLAALSALASSAGAQILRGPRTDSVSVSSSSNREISDFERRSSGTIDFMQVRPLGELQRNIRFGYGANATYLFMLDKAHILGLRLNGSLADYGRESKRVALSQTIGGRIQVDVKTDNMIGTLGIGPQLMFPTGIVRPYVNVGVGGILFQTSSHIEGLEDTYDNEFTTRNYSDGTPTYTMGTGINIPLSRKSFDVLLDLGAEYFYGGEASYLRPGSIVDVTNTQIQIFPLHSETRFLLVNLGIRISH